MTELQNSGIQITGAGKLHTTGGSSIGPDLFWIRCFCFFLCMLGMYDLLREALQLTTGTLPVIGGIGIQCLLLGGMIKLQRKYRFLRLAYAALLGAAAVLTGTKVHSGYLAMENQIRNRLNDYYQMQLANKELPVKGESGVWFLLLVFGILIVLLSRQVIYRGHLALLLMLELLFLTGGLALGCKYESLGVYLMAIGAFVLLAMRYERGPRSPKLLAMGGILTLLLVILLTGCSIWAAPRIKEHTKEIHQHLFQSMQEVSRKLSARFQGQNGFWGDHTPTADGSLNNYPVDQEEETDLIVTFQEKPENNVYLRGFIGDTYEGTYWHKADSNAFYAAFPQEKADQQIQNLLYQYVAGQFPDIPEQTVSVRRVNPGGDYGYAPYGFALPDDENLEGDSFYGSAAEVKEYSGYVNWRSLAGAGAADDSQSELEASYQDYVADQYLKVPVHGLDRLKEYCASRQFQTVQEVIDFVVSDVQEGRSYSMDLKPVPQDTDFAEFFFFDEKKGYCIHYASTATLMLRIFGVPARYATGYVVTPERFAETEDGYTAEISDTQAHAWVEVYRTGKGWIPLEVTPGYEESLTDDHAQDREQEPETTEEPSGEPETEVSAEPSPQENPTQESKETTPTEEIRPDSEGDGRASLEAEDAAEGKAAPGGWAGSILLGLLLVLTGLLLVYLLLVLRGRKIRDARRKRFLQKNRNQGICEISYELTRLLEEQRILGTADRDLDRARQIEEQLEFLEPDTYVQMIRLVQQAAYSDKPLSEQQWKQCMDLYQKVAAGLWNRQTWKGKIRWKYMKCHDLP